MTPYYFSRGAAGLGIGVENLAFRNTAGPPSFNPYSPKYVVNGSLANQGPGFVRLQKNYMPVALRGNGVTLSGAIELQRLAQMQKA